MDWRKSFVLISSLFIIVGCSKDKLPNECINVLKEADTFINFVELNTRDNLSNQEKAMMKMMLNQITRERLSPLFTQTFNEKGISDTITQCQDEFSNIEFIKSQLASLLKSEEEYE